MVRIFWEAAGYTIMAILVGVLISLIHTLYLIVKNNPKQGE